MDILKESFASLKTDLLATVERKVEDEVSKMLEKKDDGNIAPEDNMSPICHQ